ncbi:hypothetical protein PLAN_30031 [Planktothrix rubescens CCAP 1459/22]|uniref:Uncharacterized protein n=1 Tax=Planktothrix rubescens CCAP 1459/22 TaxID=329571 RepID=A0A6J7ZLD5_PLARU|nr:hypothetical protein PLAN_30031 [Planktothrix rubescens NIVA-CYA 18]CAD0227960.1 conserved hypothetical protein [Planktothrix agardhii]
MKLCQNRSHANLHDPDIRRTSETARHPESGGGITRHPQDSRHSGGTGAV